MATACAKCGSERIVPRAAVWDRIQGGGGNYSLTAWVYARPEAILMKEAAYSELFARICADCGYTELFAEKPDGLYAAYDRSRPVA